MRVIGAKKVEREGYDKWWLCVIVNDTELDKYDLTGADVDGMDDDDRIAAGSLIATPTANYIAFADGIFTQSELAGGGGGGGGVAAGVNTWNGRSGNVYPRSGDYDAAKISTTISGKSVQVILDELQAATALDPTLSTSSTRAVQNQAIAIAINELRGMCVPAGGFSGDLLAKVDGNNYNTEWVSSSEFMRRSQYDTDADGIVDRAAVAMAVKGSSSYLARLKTINGDTYLLTEKDKAVAGGVVPLDANRKILPEFLPDNIYGGMTYGGIFNATTRVVRLTAQAKSILGISDDTMTLQNSSTVPEGYPANVELYYVTKTAGTFAGMDFGVGDWLISIGTEWQQLIFGNKVSSVNGQTGAVELNSDQITQGSYNLYMTPAEQAKLSGIEAQATKDTDVIQTAQVVEDTSGNKELVLTNKNGTVVRFAGGGTADLAEYLKKNGNGSNVYALYSQAAGSQPAFSGNETEAIFRGKILAWFDALQAVAFSGSYNDLSDRPTKTSQFTNDGNGNSAYPFITSQVTNLQNYYKKDQTYSKAEVDAIVDALDGMNFVVVAALPTEDINKNTIYLVPKTGGGHTRWWHSESDGWLNFGDTDVDMSGYLETDGDGSAVTVAFTQALTKELPETGESLAVIVGKILAYLADLKTVAFTGMAEDLDDYATLATKEDLEDYVAVQQAVADSGKVMGVDDEGKVRPVSIAAGVMRRGEGAMSVIGNDTEESPLNTAAGGHAMAIGNGTIATSADQVAEGRYNVEDASGAYAHIIGGGSPSERKNIATIDWGGHARFAGGVSVGNTTDNIITPTAGNDLTPKNYVDKTVEEEIARANLLKAMVVQEIPDVDDADSNILYLLKDPTAEDVYIQYKKVLESQDPDVYIMAKLGSTQITSSETQVQVLPTPSVAFDGMTYQYVGTSSDHDFGFFYTCKAVQYFAWLSTDDAKYYYTLSATPSKWGKIFDENMAPIAATVATVAENTLTDNAGKTYTRLAAQDTSRYEWVELNGKLSEYTNDGSGSGAPNDYFVTRANALTKQADITEVADTTTISKVVPETGDVTDVTAKKIFDYMWKKIYPVGSIYITVSSDSPATLFGGTWSLVGTDRVLWGVSASTAAGGTLDEQLPDIRGHIDWASGGQAKTEISSGTGAFSLTNKNLGAAYPTGTGASSSARGFDFRASYYNTTYKLNASVRPAAYTVHIWRRTA